MKILTNFIKMFPVINRNNKKKLKKEIHPMSYYLEENNGLKDLVNNMTNINGEISKEKFEVLEKIIDDTNNLKNFLNSITYMNDEIPNEKLEILKKLIDDTEKMKQILKPISKLFHFEFSIMGGAIRDFLLGYHDNIKDIDIMISFDLDNVQYSRASYPRSLDWAYFFNNFENKEELIEITKKYLNNEQYEEIAFTVFKELLKNKTIIDSEFSPQLVVVDKSDENTSGYKDINGDKLINGIIKIKDAQFNYPIDIILTNLETKDFVEKFDFGICQCHLPFNLDDYMYKDMKDYIKKMNLTKDFLMDGLNKTITLKLNNNPSIEDLQFSMNNHYQRIKEKYSEYSLEFEVTDNKEGLSFAQHWKLNQEINIKEEKPAKKMKI